MYGTGDIIKNVGKCTCVKKVLKEFFFLHFQNSFFNSTVTACNSQETIDVQICSKTI